MTSPLVNNIFINFYSHVKFEQKYFKIAALFVCRFVGYVSNFSNYIFEFLFVSSAKVEK